VPTEAELLAQITTLGKPLQKRADKSRLLNAYVDGCPPFPEAVVRARMTTAYRVLMPMAQAPWAGLVTESVMDRLEPAGIRSGVKETDDAIWGIWQDNQMDSEAKLGHNAALVDGRCFAIVWPDEKGQPEIVLDSSEQVIVQYRAGSRRRRVAALRYWVEDQVPMVNLYRPEAIYKFQGPKDETGIEGVAWKPREVPGEQWPLANPLGVVPVVEVPVNRKLKPGAFGHARGEFEHCTGLLDRIHLLTFLGLVVALWMGFPLRGVIGQKIMRDDEGKPIPPFDADVDKAFAFENPQAKLAEFAAADRKNLSIFQELSQLAYVTKTPAHYFPLEMGISNISADAIRALEGGMHAKVSGHKATLGEGWEEVLRLGGLMLDQPVQLSPRAQLLWKDNESRSLAERADAATKLKDILPWQALAEQVLNASQDDISRWESMRASDAMGALIAAAQNGSATAPTG
jgi:hypothetical protein